MIVNFKLPLAKGGEHVGVVSIGTDDVTIGIDLPRIDDALYMFVSGQCEKAAESMADGGAFEISDAAAVGEALLKVVLDQIERKTIVEALANLLIKERA